MNNIEKKDESKDRVADTQTHDPQKLLARQREDVSLRDLFNKFFEEDFGLFSKQFIPRVDLSETQTHVKVVADVPGVNPDDIDIDVQNNRMIISGSTKRESSPDERPYRYERTYGEFRREFTLPSEVKKEDAKAVYKNGTLTITLPKTETKKGSKIEIEKQ